MRPEQISRCLDRSGPQQFRYRLFLFLLTVLVPAAGLCPPAFGGTAVQRIISLGPINTENIYLLGAQEMLVANTRYCVRPPPARYKEKIGTVTQIRIEKIISLRPDLILATGLTQPAQIRKLRELGLRVVQFAQPKSFADICAHLLRLGRLLDREEQATELVKRARQEVTAIRKKVQGHGRPKVFLQVGTDPLFGAVPGSFTDDFITFAGGRNILADQRSAAVSREKVVALNPDIVLIAIMGSETGLAGREKAQWLGFPALRAVRDRRVHIVDPNLICSPSPATFVKALRLVARLIHPELFQEKEHGPL
ncbi:ABC transporter substrate-binding protein [Desulfolithobacter sp.]